MKKRLLNVVFGAQGHIYRLCDYCVRTLEKTKYAFVSVLTCWNSLLSGDTSILMRQQNPHFTQTQHSNKPWKCKSFIIINIDYEMNLVSVWYGVWWEPNKVREWEMERAREREREMRGGGKEKLCLVVGQCPMLVSALLMSFDSI